MKVVIIVTKNFISEAKPLLKKYPSLRSDLLLLQEELKVNPTLGISLGKNAYKIRLRVISKGKGKSGGARVVTLLENELIAEITNEENIVTVNLMSIYDKGDTATISETELKTLISILRNERKFR